MKKIISIFLITTLLVTISGCNKKENNNERYNEIKKDFEEALIKMLDATGLSNKNNGCDDNTSKGTITSSTLLIKNGYLKKEKMKDIDKKDYCEAVAVTYKTDDCGVDYNIYLKCKDYVDDGFYSWDQQE